MSEHNPNWFRYEKNGVMIMATEKDSGGVDVMINHKGVTDHIVIPKRNREDYRQGFQMLVAAFESWD